MTLHTWLIISSIIGLLIGLMLVFAPQNMAKQFGLKVDGTARLFARSTGAGILALALINWTSRNYTGSDVIWGIVGANILIHAVTGYDDLKNTLNKTYKPTANGWGSVVFHLLFIVVFGYYLIFGR